MKALKQMETLVTGLPTVKSEPAGRLIMGNPDEPWKSPFTQQGDCIIKKIGDYSDVFVKGFSKMPPDIKPIQGNLVLKGSTNSHALYGGKFQLFTSESHPEYVFLRVEEPTVLDHVTDLRTGNPAEHYAQWIPKGDYFYDGLKEYDHISEEQRRVLD